MTRQHWQPPPRHTFCPPVRIPTSTPRQSKIDLPTVQRTQPGAYTQAINEFNHWRQDAKITDGLIREYLHHLSARVSEQTGKPLSVATIRAKVTAIKSDLKAFGLSHVFGPKVTRHYPELSGTFQANTGRGQVTGIQHDPMVEIVVRCEIEEAWPDGVTRIDPNHV